MNGKSADENWYAVSSSNSTVLSADTGGVLGGGLMSMRNVLVSTEVF